LNCPDTLPMTGSSTLVLALVGIALVGGGVALLAIRRRKLSTGVMAIGLLVAAATFSHAPRAEAQAAPCPATGVHAPGQPALPPPVPPGHHGPGTTPTTRPGGHPSTTFPLGIPTTTTTLPIGIPTTETPTTDFPIGVPTNDSNGGGGND
jgi:LPXTG-motif cell wall-anchored protein